MKVMHVHVFHVTCMHEPISNVTHMVDSSRLCMLYWSTAHNMECRFSLTRVPSCCTGLQQTTWSNRICDVFCSVLQCVAVCCSVLQCVAVCCSVLQCDFHVVLVYSRQHGVIILVPFFVDSFMCVTIKT